MFDVVIKILLIEFNAFDDYLLIFIIQMVNMTIVSRRYPLHRKSGRFIVNIQDGEEKSEMSIRHFYSNDLMI